MDTFCLQKVSSLPPLSLAPCPPFPFRPCHWEPKTPTSICAFLNYTRQLKVVLIRNPDYFLKNRFELEAYILLLHTCYPEEEGKFVWFSMARQILGRPLATYESGELREDQRTWAIVRVQSACRDLIWPERWEEEDGRVKAASFHMQKVIRKAMLAYVRSEQAGIPDFIPREELRKCERWLQKVVIPHVQGMLNGEYTIPGLCEWWIGVLIRTLGQETLTMMQLKIIRRTTFRRMLWLMRRTKRGS